MKSNHSILNEIENLMKLNDSILNEFSLLRKHNNSILNEFNSLSNHNNSILNGNKSLTNNSHSVLNDLIFYEEQAQMPKKWAERCLSAAPRPSLRKSVCYFGSGSSISIIQCRVNRCLIQWECPAVGGAISRRSDHLPTPIGQRVTIVFRTTRDVITTHTLT